VLPLPHADEERVETEARALGVGVYGMDRYRSGPTHPPALVLGYGDVGVRDIQHGMAAIADVVANHGP